MSGDSKVISRRRGCLFGLAIGDAMGASVEFKQRGAFEPVTGYRTGGPHRLAAGEWTDDTSMALSLADSIATVGWDLADQMCRYLDWYQNGTYSVSGDCFDIGLQTQQALSNFERDGDPRQSASRAESASGNGSIMRLAPVPIRYVEWIETGPLQLAELAAESSLPTHASSQCLSACRYLSLVLAGLMHGLDREEVLSPFWQPVMNLEEISPLHPAIREIADGSFRMKHADEISGSGYVVKSLEAALWAFHDAQSFHDAILKAVNLGDDADTTGAVCGQLAGAFWGMEGIPPAWLDGLARRDMIESALSGLVPPSD